MGAVSEDVERLRRARPLDERGRGGTRSMLGVSPSLFIFTKPPNPAGDSIMSSPVEMPQY